MRLFLIFISLVFLFTECKSKKQADESSSDVQEKPMSYEELTTKEANTSVNSDTVLLGFILTAQKANVMRHVDSLIIAGKLQEKIKDFTIWGEPGDYHKFEFEGYPYKIYMNTVDSFTTYISFDFLKDKLHRINLNVRELPSNASLKEFLTSIYGEPNYVDEAGMQHWIKGKRDIKLTRGFIPITFTSIQLDSENHVLKNAEDSIGASIQKSKIDKSRADFK